MIARVCGDLHHGFDFGRLGDDSSDSDQFSHLVGFDVANRRQFLSVGSLEVDLEAAEKLGRVSVPAMVIYMNIGVNCHKSQQ